MVIENRTIHVTINHIIFCLQQYIKQSSLHGFRFMTNRSSQTLFLAAVSCSFILCAFIINLELFHSTNHVTTKIESTSYPVWKVPFPSVTVCNYNVVYKDNIKNILDVVQHRGIPEGDFYDLFYNLSSLIAYDELDDISRYSNVYDTLHLYGYTTDRLMEELAQPCSDMLQKCLWQTVEVPCLKLFSIVKTTQGYCCSFNFHKLHTGFRNIEDKFYKYAKGAGPTFSLQLILNINEKQYASATKSLYGFKVLVQDGIHYPDLETTATTILSKEEVTISVAPMLFSSSEEIKVYGPSERCCLFHDEGNLKWTSNYSYITCMNECRAEVMLKICQCIPFYYPGHRNQRTCTLLDVPCLRDNMYNFSALNIRSCDNGEELPNEHKRSNFHCNCYPQCNEIMYKVHINKATNIPIVGYENSNFSILNVYYNTNGCIKYNRELQTTWDYTLAFIGGCFGFCFGGSIISILECFYFLIKFSIKSNNKNY